MAIDNLDYFYHQDNKNLLLKVTDATNATQGFNDDSDGTDDTTDDYSYDANGNMTKDENKNITSILYNHLDLPVRIDFVNNRKIEYLYNAIGQKLQKKVFYNEPTVTTDYVDGFQYTNGILKFFPHAEGYANAVFSEDMYKFYYVFSYLDHLGNIRLNYGEDPSDGVLKIMEENHYYPFGLKHSNYNTGAKGFVKELELYRLMFVDVVNVPYKYKYNGKELQDELGLNMYDYGARLYDPALGRFSVPDPLAEKYFSETPYNYVTNNPVNAIDPDGMDRYIINENGKTTLALKEDKADMLFAYNSKTGDLTDTNKDGKADASDALTIESKGLIGQLVNPRYSDGSGTAHTSIGEQSKQHEKDYFSLFKYASDNAKNVEFSLSFFNHNGKDWIEFGTYNDPQVSPGNNAGQSKTYKSYHSHSDTKNDIRTERYSMGDRGDNWPYSYPANDFNNSMYFKTPYTKYVYFPNSTRLYSVTKESIDYIKKINKPSDYKVKK